MSWDNKMVIVSLDENEVCLVQRLRDIDFEILNRKTNSSLVNPQFFSFENLDRRGNSLNLGETVLLQE